MSMNNSLPYKPFREWAHQYRVIHIRYVFIVLIGCLAVGCTDSSDNAVTAPHFEADGSRILRDAETLSDPQLGGRAPYTSGAEHARDYIVAQLASIDGVMAAGTNGWLQAINEQWLGLIHPLTQAQSDYPAANILAMIPGSDPELAGEYIVLSAHYDHLSPNAEGEVNPGAVDNAGGVAIALEVSRALAAAANKPRRSVLIAFWDLEEAGLLGSEYFTQFPTVSLDSIDTVIALDGWGDALTPSLNSEGFAIGVDRVPLVASLLSSPRAGESDYDFFAVSSLLFPPRSDHVPFLQKGIPAVHLTSGQDARRYHSPRDTIEHVQPDILEAGSRSILRLMVALADNTSQKSILLEDSGIGYYPGDIETLQRITETWMLHPEDIQGRAPELLTFAPQALEIIERWKLSPPANPEEEAAYVNEIVSKILILVLAGGLVP